MILKRLSRLFILTLILFCSALGLSVIAGGEEAQHEAPIPSGTPTPVNDHAGVVLLQDKPQACIASSSAVEDIQKRKQELEAKQKDLANRESEIKARELALFEEIKKLERMREQIAGIDQARKAENDTRVKKVVETLETMSPKAASVLLGGLDEMLAVAAMAQISTGRLAKILNIMEPGRSSRLTELLAGVVRARGQSASQAVANASIDVSETANKSIKGGEKNDGTNQQQHSINGNRQPGNSQEKGKGTK
ncbi:MAG: hypothetical protein AABZ55_03220 [Bdellovibrionota bacterium]